MYLLRKIPNTKIIFIYIIRSSDKLNFTKLKFFRILKALGPVIYKLNILGSIRITRICYILILKLVDPEASLIKDILDINPES